MTAPNYTDFSQEYKWIPQTDVPSISKRNMGIFAMCMNALGLPDKLHEFVFGVFVAGNWDRTDSYDEISLMRIARALSHNEVVQLKIFNRLKKNSPKFFEWQDKQTFRIIDRVLLREHTTHHKTKAKYRFELYETIEGLFALPLEAPAAAVRRTVERALKDYPTVHPTQKKARRKRPESTAKAVIKMATETVQLTGSIEAANLYLEEAAKSGEISVQILPPTKSK